MRANLIRHFDLVVQYEVIILQEDVPIFPKAVAEFA